MVFFKSQKWALSQTVIFIGEHFKEDDLLDIFVTEEIKISLLLLTKIRLMNMMKAKTGALFCQGKPTMDQGK